MKNLSLQFALIFCIGFVPLYAQNTMVKIDDIYPKELQLEGFRLNNSQEINIETAGAFCRSHRNRMLLGNAWILNSDSREVVWSMEPADNCNGHLKVQNIEDKITLPAGVYEVYYSSYPYFSYHNGWDEHHIHSIGDFIAWLFDEAIDDNHDWEDWRKYRNLYQDFKIVVKGNGQSLSDRDIIQRQNELKRKAFIALSAEKDNYYKYQGFELTAPARLKVYAVGEAREDGNFDYGWILNTKTREKVWTLDYWDAEKAGGSDKNVKEDRVVDLPAGQYAAVFITDDSHSPHEWNTAPPTDPYFWGLTLTFVSQADQELARKFDYHPFPEKKKIFSLSPLRDDDYAVQGFTLKQPMDLHLYAIGEGRDGEMFDYGWLVDAKTHKKVWEMKYRNTEHAGGSQKNRMVDEIINFDKGSYLVYFVTDGSHAFRDWNASPPYDPEHWGLSVYIADSRYSSNDVQSFNESDDPSVLAKIVRVGDDAFRGEDFELEKDGYVRIYSIGEGMDYQMYDYAWIENATKGKVVWEMSYRMTESAGGDQKNRQFNDKIFLPAGKYRVYYKSDDSHSFNDWNASPPHDPMNYGVTVYLMGK